jgi:hypothetical protein
MRYAIIDAKGAVVNAIEWDGVTPWSPPEGHQAVHDPSDNVGPGWTHANGAFTPPPSVPRPLK